MVCFKVWVRCFGVCFSIRFRTSCFRLRRCVRVLWMLCLCDRLNLMWNDLIMMNEEKCLIIILVM